MLLSTAITTGTLVATATPASADTPRCVTHQEYRRVHVGMKKARVHRLFDISGQFADGAAGGYTRFYASCQSVHSGGGDSGAYVTYDGLTARVLEKRFV